MGVGAANILDAMEGQLPAEHENENRARDMVRGMPCCPDRREVPLNNGMQADSRPVVLGGGRERCAGGDR